jgi:hypothetical protein
LHSNPRKLAAALVCFALIPVAAARSTRVFHRNLEELTQLADRAFVGTCASVEEKRRGDLYFTEYRFAVEERIKGLGPARGAQSSIVTVRQLSAPPGGAVVGLPRYRQGARYLLMIHADSDIGLTSPVGFAQGVFLVYQDGAGDQAVNPVGNLGLFHRMSPEARRWETLAPAERALLRAPRGPVDAGRLIALVRRLARGVDREPPR